MINVLLTGAGFTANFGSPLAREIYEALFNNTQIQKNEILRSKLLEEKNIANSDYENLYQDIIDDSSIDSRIKDLFSNSIWEVFSNKVDSHCRQPFFETDVYGNNQKNDIGEFLIKFSNTSDKSIFFTLNQDLFIERNFYHVFDYYNNKCTHLIEKLKSLKINRDLPIAIKRLGVPDNNIGKYDGSFIDRYKIKNQDYDLTGAKSNFDEWLANKSNYCFYIKLHGSMDFFDEKDQALFITGTNKKLQINGNKLISFYNEIFRDVAKEMSSTAPYRFFIIGYGFNDSHINIEINNFLKNNNSMIYIIDKNEYGIHGFLEKIKEKGICVRKLENQLKGYWSNGFNSECLKEILNIFDS